MALFATTLSQIARAKYGYGRRGLRRALFRDPDDGGVSREMEDRVAQLEQELQAVRGELGDVQERLDFTERILAKQKDAGKLGA
ncbi:MAG TPA: hypothetical protein VGI83_07670 [Gemmatimonadales bacterium]